MAAGATAAGTPASIVTGANRGIGAGLRDELIRRGHEVIGTRREATASAQWLPLDVCDPGSVREMATALGARPISLLVCNAGIFPDKGQRLDDGYPAPMWAESFETNVTGVFLTIQALLPNLERAGGKIAIVSSQMASSERAPGGSLIYRASKAAALNLGRNLSVDLKPRGIAVGIYHPGWVRTDMGGGGADISVEEAAQGLADRFDALDLAQTGCFKRWDGSDHPF